MFSVVVLHAVECSGILNKYYNAMFNSSGSILRRKHVFGDAPPSYLRLDVHLCNIQPHRQSSSDILIHCSVVPLFLLFPNFSQYRGTTELLGDA